MDRQVIKETAIHYSTGVFDPNNETDARERVAASIVRRRGQPAFRQKLLTIYNGRCAITGTDAEAALEAAHILPYKGLQTNDHRNGLLLRSDIHTLFDLYLIAIDANSMSVLVAPELHGTTYESLQGVKLCLPLSNLDCPSIDALNKHRQEAGL